MRKFILICLLIVAVFISRPKWEPYLSPYVDLSFLDTVTASFHTVINRPEVQKAADTIGQTVETMAIQIDSLIDGNESAKQLATIDFQNNELPDGVFSVHRIEIGDTMEDVMAEAGEAKRVTMNEYGSKWHTYHKDYANYFMVSYNQEGLVNGLYTNQDLISSTYNISMDTPKAEVRKQFGEPIDKLRKGMTFYLMDDKDEYDLYFKDGQYITIFYDKHEKDTVTAIQIVTDELENQKHTLYGSASPELKEGFEFQLFDLTNAARVQHGLPTLTWDEHVRETARKHSSDMANNHFFNHTNLEGQSPFDRMLADGIYFTYAGENLAYGQYSSIFAHEGLMNSLGHRENILNNDFSYLGIGVAFNEESQPYYTENFFNK
ncbi:CAP domain-containing protein [Chungangia koreensis]|uniref:CAP domain-containing protein n=1 Tax=Chungangia koreensis TaxID=752657 RepID=A0ABV8X4S5_9LACT